MYFLIINGPNLNRLGKREPDIYGVETYDDLCKSISDYAQPDTVDFYQSNHEGALIDAIQNADGLYDGIVLNAGAYTHYSYAIHDALRCIDVPTVEVHISDISAREPWRQVSVIAPACKAQIMGHGFQGYCEAIDLLRTKPW